MRKGRLEPAETCGEAVLGQNLHSLWHTEVFGVVLWEDKEATGSWGGFWQIRDISPAPEIWRVRKALISPQKKRMPWAEQLHLAS